METPDGPRILGQPGRLHPQDTTETLGQLLARVLRLIEHQTTVLEHLCARLDALEDLLRDRNGPEEDDA